MKKFLLSASLMMLFTVANLHAQDFETTSDNDDNGFHFSTEFVTEDVWRGGFAGSAAFEPEISYSIGGFSVGSWASSPLNYGNDNYNELDFFMQYDFNCGLSIVLNDYCWTNDNNQFDYFGRYKDNHFFEAGLAYDLSAVAENVPLSFNVNTMIAGANLKENGDQAFSTYMELIYAPSLKNVDLSLTLGAAVEDEEAAMYSRKGSFNVVNVDLQLSHDFKIKDAAILSVRANIVCNPTGIEKHGEAYVLGGIGISF